MFAAPAFLLGLLAIGVPLWLHRMARANPTQQPFASLMLIEASETERSAKRTLRYWLLLATRIALLVALALAFAGLLLPANVTPLATTDARLHAIVLDTSLSMRQGERWARALEEARSVLDDLQRGDQAMLVTAAGRRIEVAHEPVTADNAGLLRAALQQVEPGVNRLDYGLLMTTAQGWLGSARLPAELHLISDLQHSASPVRFADLQPPPRTRIVLHDVSAGDGANTYLDSIAVDPQDGRTLHVTASTTAGEPQKREAILIVNGKERQRRSIELPAADAAPVSRRMSFPSVDLGPGTHRLEVALEPQDGLPQDDRLHAVIEQADPRVLLIARDTSADEAAYLAAGIESVNAPRLTVERRAATDVKRQHLSGYSAVVVADSSVLSSAAAAAVRDYVDAGGAALVTLGAGAATQRDPLTELQGRLVGNRPARIGYIDASHVVLRDPDDWHRVHFFRHLQIDPSAGRPGWRPGRGSGADGERSDRTLITLDDGSPLLIERYSGAGRLLILTAPLDREWNDIAIHPLFVRFVADVARYLSAHDASTASVHIGASVMTGLTGPAAGQIFDPQGRRALSLGETTAARFVPEAVGFYEIRGAQGSRWIAVNVDRRESDLRGMPQESVQRWRALEPRPPAGPAATEAQERPPQRSLGELFLLIAALLAVAEIAMANHRLAVRRDVASV